MSRKLSISGALLILGLCLGLVGLVADGSPAAAAPAKKASAAEQGKININSASEIELTKIPGVGPALAKRIIEFREQHGPFRRLEDIMKVRGIGEKSYQKMRAYITVEKRA